jgi:AmiR/NasT family two-component response regulator
MNNPGPQPVVTTGLTNAQLRSAPLDVVGAVDDALTATEPTQAQPESVLTVLKSIRDELAEGNQLARTNQTLLALIASEICDVDLDLDEPVEGHA